LRQLGDHLQPFLVGSVGGHQGHILTLNIRLAGTGWRGGTGGGLSRCGLAGVIRA
jgi:hypothetical protein